MIHGLALHAHDKVARVHGRHFAIQRLGGVAGHLGLRIGLRGLLQQPQQIYPGAEDTNTERLATAGLDAFRVLVEEIEVAAEIEDTKVRLVLPRTKEIRAQPCAPPDHLPKLDLGIHRLEEHQIHHLRHIDAGVQHVHGNGDMGCLVLLGEIVDQRLDVVDLVGNHPGKVPGVFRVVVVETLFDKVRVGLVAGEDDGLAEAVATLHLMAVLHKVLETLVHGVLIEQPVVQGGGVHLLRDQGAFRHIVTPLQGFPLSLFVLGQVVVANAFPGKAQIHLLYLRRHQIAIADRLAQLIGVRGHALFQIEQVIGVLVHLLPGGGGQAKQHGVEIAENRPVALIHRAVGLVDDDQIEVPHPEPGLVGIGAQVGIDQAHHGRIGTHIHPAFGVLLGDQVHRAGFWQVGLEGIHRLVHQRHPVRQEQGALDPVGPLQHVH